MDDTSIKSNASTVVRNNTSSGLTHKRNTSGKVLFEGAPRSVLKHVKDTCDVIHAGMTKAFPGTSHEKRLYGALAREAMRELPKKDSKFLANLSSPNLDKRAAAEVRMTTYIVKRVQDAVLDSNKSVSGSDKRRGSEPDSLADVIRANAAKANESPHRPDPPTDTKPAARQQLKPDP